VPRCTQRGLVRRGHWGWPPDATALQTIDIHFHVAPPRFVDAVRRRDFSGVVEIDSTTGADRLVFHAPRGVAIEPDSALRPHVYDPRLILAAMDRRKLDAAAISPPPELLMYWAPPELGARIARAMNDGMAELAHAHPDRFLPLATLPLQDVTCAAGELDRAVTRLGLRGACICTHVNGVDLDDPRVAPVFEMAERLGVPLFLHPQNAGDVTRLKDYHLWNLIGFPMETATAAARLILAGVFERFPGLIVVLAHGGGFLPYQLGRLDHGYRVRAALQERLPKHPSEYLGNIYCDSLVHNNAALRYLLERIGVDHVVLGSDYPFDMGTETAADDLRALRLPRAQESAVLGGTLARLLRIT
jgi:aminocarboxymuconate-semialdehyde decarboxylase